MPSTITRYLYLESIVTWPSSQFFPKSRLPKLQINVFTPRELPSTLKQSKGQTLSWQWDVSRRWLVALTHWLHVYVEGSNPIARQMIPEPQAPARACGRAEYLRPQQGIIAGLSRRIGVDEHEWPCVGEKSCATCGTWSACLCQFIALVSSLVAAWHGWSQYKGSSPIHGKIANIEIPPTGKYHLRIIGTDLLPALKFLEWFLKSYSRTLQQFPRTLQKFSRSLRELSRSLQKFSRTLQKFSRTLQEFLGCLKTSFLRKWWAGNKGLPNSLNSQTKNNTKMCSRILTGSRSMVVVRSSVHTNCCRFTDGPIKLITADIVTPGALAGIKVAVTFNTMPVCHREN